MEQLLDQALLLPPALRFKLIQKLMKSLEPAIDTTAKPRIKPEVIEEAEEILRTTTKFYTQEEVDAILDADEAAYEKENA